MERSVEGFIAYRIERTGETIDLTVRAETETMTVVLRLIVGEKSHRYRTRRMEGRSADLGKTFLFHGNDNRQVKFTITVFTAEGDTIYLVTPVVCHTYIQVFVVGRLLVPPSDIPPIVIIYSPYPSPTEHDQIT